MDRSDAVDAGLSGRGGALPLGRVGALAVALGVGMWALAVPVIACADTADPAGADSAGVSVSAESAGKTAVSAGRGVVVQRAPRASRAAAVSALSPGTRRGGQVGPAAATATIAAPHQGLKGAPARSRRNSAPAMSTPAPSASLPAAAVAVSSDPDPTAGSPKAPTAAPGGAELSTLAAPADCRTCASLKAPIASALYPVERVIDVVGSALSRLPANAVTDFLTGSLWLVRRSLFPVGADVGLWGSAACVATKDCRGQNLTGADFSRKDLTGVKFDDAILDGAYFIAADLTDASLKGATWTHVKFDDADLTRADLTGADLRYQNLVGATLTEANLMNADLREARLWGRVATELASAILIGANFTGQRFSSANGTTLDWAGKDLTGIKLARANLTGADLGQTNLTDAELEGVNLTRANLFEAKLPGPSWASPLVTATLVGAYLTNIDLSGADLSGMNLTGTVLDGAKLLRTKLKSTNLTGARLVGAKLDDADLTRADLTRANLFNAVLTGATLTGAVWRDTTCPYGGKTSSGCSSVALLNQPPADWLAAASERRPGPNQWWPWQWYQYGGPGVEPSMGQKPPPILRGTPGAPLVNRQFRDSAGYATYSNDGIQGMIYNKSDQRVVVEVPFRLGKYGEERYYWSTAVLDPGDSVSYQLFDIPRARDSNRGGNLLFYRYADGQVTGNPATLTLEDPNSGRPLTQFTPPGWSVPFGTRLWNTGEQHSELWGGVNIQVKREREPWSVTGSPEYLEYYKFTGSWETSDWRIFTITIKGL